MDENHTTRTRAESPRSIIGRGSRGGQVAESKGVMQELTPLGRKRRAHSEETSRTRKFQARQSVVGGWSGGRILRGGSSSSSLPVAGAGSRGSIPPSAVDAFECRGTKLTQELKEEVSHSIASGSITKKHCSWDKLSKE